MSEYTIPERIVKASFKLSVYSIGKFSDKQYYQAKADKLSLLPEGTVGKAIANCLETHQLSLVPGFESHDLKHVLLNYPMTPLGETRLQAFMLGNGNWSAASVAIFVFGLIMLPNHLKLYWQDYKAGQNAVPIKTWQIEYYAQHNLADLQQTIYQTEKATTMNVNTLLSYGSITTGILGMLVCLPFLFSSNIADLVGAGLPFIAGSVLVVGGLMSLSLQTAAKAELIKAT